MKIYGNNPKKLLNKIKEKRDTNIKVLPLILKFLIKILYSLCKVIIILIHKIFNREGISQNIEGIIKIPIKDLNQFNDKLKFVAGSKEENKLAIIFN